MHGLNMVILKSQIPGLGLHSRLSCLSHELGCFVPTIVILSDLLIDNHSIRSLIKCNRILAITTIMTVILGKRKRRAHIEGSNQIQPSEQAVDHKHQLLQSMRQHFETRFEPLEPSDVVLEQEPPIEEHGVSNVSDTDWTGFSEDKEDDNALVVDYQGVEKTRPDVSREELKLFMVIGLNVPTYFRFLNLTFYRAQNPPFSRPTAHLLPSGKPPNPLLPRKQLPMQQTSRKTWPCKDY